MQSEPANQNKSSDEDDPQHILESLINRAFARAKVWAGTVVTLECFLFLAGIVAVFNPIFTLSYPWIAFPLAMLGARLSDRASGAREAAETMKRQYEYLMGFGVAPNRDYLADLLISLPKELPEETEALLRTGLRYWSKKPQGPIRTLDNLIESAWFTKHLAQFWGHFLAVVFTVSAVLAVSVLLLCATSLGGTSAAEIAAKCVAGTLLFLISVGILRLCFSYHSLARRAGEVDVQANSMAKAGNPNTFEVQTLLGEYQLARASGPLIPTWAWKLRRDSLNAAWERLKHPRN